MDSAGKLHIEPVIGFFLAFLLWFVTVDVLKLLNPLLIPPLIEVFARLSEIAKNGSLGADFLSTMMRWIKGFSLGAVLGIFAGLLLGRMTRTYNVLEGPLEFFRAMPVTAIFPLFLMIFGIGDESKIAMAFLPTFLLMLVNARYGVVHSSPQRQRAVQVFGATEWQIFRHVIFFEALPQIFIGLRLAISLSLIVTVVSEMFIGTDAGLGQRIYDSYLTSSITTLYALLLVLGFIGYFINKICIFFEKRVVFWAGRT